MRPTFKPLPGDRQAVSYGDRRVTLPAGEPGAPEPASGEARARKRARRRAARASRRANRRR
jgi:hypothetical protein